MCYTIQEQIKIAEVNSLISVMVSDATQEELLEVCQHLTSMITNNDFSDSDMIQTYMNKFVW